MKHFLKNDFEFEFQLIGLSCHEKDYRICWALNQALDVELTKTETDLELVLKKRKKTSFYSVFEYKNDDTLNEYYLINNRSTNGLLINELPHLDYFVMVKENYPVDINDAITHIKKIPFILTAYSVSVDSLVSKENLIF